MAISNYCFSFIVALLFVVMLILDHYYQHHHDVHFYFTCFVNYIILSEARFTWLLFTTNQVMAYKLAYSLTLMKSETWICYIHAHPFDQYT